MLLGSLHVLLCCCRPLDDTEDIDPDLMEDGEMVADLDSEEECDDAEREMWTISRQRETEASLARNGWCALFTYIILYREDEYD